MNSDLSILYRNKIEVVQGYLKNVIKEEVTYDQKFFVVVVALEANKTKPLKKKVPKGTSEYQASWIVPEHDEDSEGNDSTDDDEDEENEDGDHQMFGFDEEDDSQSEVS